MIKKTGAIKMIISLLAGFLAGWASSGYFKNKAITDSTKKIDKYKMYYFVLNQWLQLKLEGKSIDKYFKDNGYQSIAIYGMGELGTRLYEDLKRSDIEVKYAIDKNVINTFSDLKVYSLKDQLEKVDVIVVTAIFAYDEIYEEISKAVDYPVISLEEAVWR